MKRLRLARSGALAAVALLAAAFPAWGHGGTSSGATPANAILIPNLTHGQMRVMADQQGAILHLADGQVPTDATMRRLRGFISLQRFVCAWGVLPGSVTDEDSPFNECAHAYLAATRALLVHLREMPGDKAATRALVRSVELQMLDNDASLVLCRYSDEFFNTASLVAPRWRDIPGHPPTLLALGGVVAVAGAGFLALGRRRSAPVRSTPGGSRA